MPTGCLGRPWSSMARRLREARRAVSYHPASKNRFCLFPPRASWGRRFKGEAGLSPSAHTRRLTTYTGMPYSVRAAWFIAHKCALCAASSEPQKWLQAGRAGQGGSSVREGG